MITYGGWAVRLLVSGVPGAAVGYCLVGTWLTMEALMGLGGVYAGSL